MMEQSIKVDTISELQPTAFENDTIAPLATLSAKITRIARAPPPSFIH
jgi:hypothetical protein